MKQVFWNTILIQNVFLFCFVLFFFVLFLVFFLNGALYFYEKRPITGNQKQQSTYANVFC